MATGKFSTVLAGGVALGAYQAGALAAMRERLDELDRLVGVSTGAVNAAIIAGNSPATRIDVLEGFWNKAASFAPPAVATGFWPRGGVSWNSVAQSRSLGVSGVFAPRSPVKHLQSGTFALYDLSPLARELARIVDFDRLNSGEQRVTMLATDLQTGEPVVFDTAAGDRIEAEHILASCGFLPEFEPVKIGGRLLGDGALSANAPVELALAGQTGDEDITCVVIDLFSREGELPRSIVTAAERRLDLLVGNPTHRALDALRREDGLRRLLALAADRVPPSEASEEVLSVQKEARRGRTTLLYLSHRPEPHGAGPEKQFDFSRTSLTERWKAGGRDMRHALGLLQKEQARNTSGFVIHHIGSDKPSAPAQG